jgi:hypothetical protein
MKSSEKIDQIAVALNKAQSVMENAKKTSANPFFHSKYADLDEVWDTARKPLADNGLSIIQSIASGTEIFRMKTPTKEQPDKESNMIWLVVTTRLLHTSEQWFEDSVSMPVEADPQSLGKVTTYIRRYALMAMVGISPEDDDGNAGSGKVTQGQQTGKQEQKPPAGDSTLAEHFCKEHGVPYTEHKKDDKVWWSHPIANSKEWCNEDKTPKSATRRMRTQEQVDEIKEAGKYFAINEIGASLGIDMTKALTFDDAAKIITECERRAAK